MMSLIWYGVFEHFPRLRVVHVEADAGWVPYWLQRMEQHWDFSGNAEHPDLKLRRPSTSSATSSSPAAATRRRCRRVVELAGDDNLVFNTDYPHPDGTWPWGMRAARRAADLRGEQAQDPLGQRRARLRVLIRAALSGCARCATPPT